MKLDVIIPTYNNNDFILQSVRSFIGQSTPVNKIIIVDDGSTDGTKDLLHSEFGSSNQVLLINNKINQGVSRSRNRGAGESKADYILFAESDGEYSRHYVRKLLFNARQKNCIVSGGGMRIPFDCKSKWGHFWRSVFESRWYLTREGKRKIVGGWLFQRNAFNAIGGYNPYLSQGEDVDLVNRLVNAGAILRWADRCFFRHHEPCSIKGVFQRFFMSGKGKEINFTNFFSHGLVLAFSIPFFWPIILLSLPLISEYRIGLYRFIHIYRPKHIILRYLQFSFMYYFQKFSVSAGFFFRWLK